MTKKYYRMVKTAFYTVFSEKKRYFLLPLFWVGSFVIMRLTYKLAERFALQNTNFITPALITQGRQAEGWQVNRWRYLQAMWFCLLLQCHVPVGAHRQVWEITQKIWTEQDFSFTHRTRVFESFWGWHHGGSRQNTLKIICICPTLFEWFLKDSSSTSPISWERAMRTSRVQ